jgi:hypothetical protein
MALHHSSLGSVREATEYTAPATSFRRSPSKSILPRSVRALSGSTRHSSSPCPVAWGTANPNSSGVTTRLGRRENAWLKIKGAAPDGVVPPTHMLT